MNSVQGVQELGQSRLSVQVRTVPRSILRDQYEFLNAGKSQPPGFAENVFLFPAPERSADIRNGTIRTAVVTAL